MVDSLSAFIKRLSIEEVCSSGNMFSQCAASKAQSISSGRYEQMASLDAGATGSENTVGTHLNILLCLQNTQELLDRGRQDKLCCYFQVLGSQKRSLFRISFKIHLSKGQQQPDWWTHLPQHLSKAQRLGGPLPGLVEELLECSADLYDRSPAGRVQLVHTGDTQEQAQLVTNTQPVSKHSDKQHPQISSMGTSSY